MNVFMHVCMDASTYVYLCICIYYAFKYLCMYACIIHTYMMRACTQRFLKIKLQFLIFLRFSEEARIP